MSCKPWCGCLANDQPRGVSSYMTSLPSDNRLHAFCSCDCMLNGGPVARAPGVTAPTPCPDCGGSGEVACAECRACEEAGYCSTPEPCPRGCARPPGEAVTPGEPVFEHPFAVATSVECRAHNAPIGYVCSGGGANDSERFVCAARATRGAYGRIIEARASLASARAEVARLDSEASHWRKEAQSSAGYLTLTRAERDEARALISQLRAAREELAREKAISVRLERLANEAVAATNANADAAQSARERAVALEALLARWHHDSIKCEFGPHQFGCNTCDTDRLLNPSEPRAAKPGDER